ncbi:hypothetical protein Caci_6951 [Catenulispora acidiphila DSM 44928]|uniref:Uncharacterized protein n=1 Tax=Catenulispora acidiphila (strain DSM 44928 / JCM 14897 / NBRC 102108 / NRRL B-24433 / ID139908) TaxID=479433 RepID=C7Q3L7_CATAD|nr:hypothetical protein [Catenulispora acidiphila]ACU75782.1 hypothetical protein Caci_6951 [Catenulispora acidiphila DSM 44928]
MIGEDFRESSAESEFLRAVGEGRMEEFLERDPSGGAILYRIVDDVVYEQLTRKIERRRGHLLCAASRSKLTAECHDRHQDNVEAVHADVLRHAGVQIANLCGWLVPRLTPVTVDAHRRRRGERGALQRPRLPAWLVVALDADPWLTELAREILVWVGVPLALNTGLWPLGAWADRRAEVLGRWGEAGELGVVPEVEQVLAAMRTRPSWYERYVETPLGRKQPPLVPAAWVGEDREPDHLELGRPELAADDLLDELAALAIDAVRARAAAGVELRTAVVEVLTGVFGGAGSLGTGSDRVADAEADFVARLLDDPAAVDRIAAVFLAIVEAPEDGSSD